MLIGNNIALVIYGVTMANLLEPQLSLIFPNDGIVLFVQTILSTLLILLTAEFLPKVLFRINPNQVLKIFSIPVYFFYMAFYPLARFTIHISSGFIRTFFRVRIQESPDNTFGKSDLDHLVNENNSDSSNENDVKHDVRIFQNALDFSNIKLRECVVPRTEIVAVSVYDTVETLKQRFIESGHSKILVYDETIDHIIGYAHSITLFQNPDSIKSMLRLLPIVPESMPANKLLAKFLRNRKSMALVVDEFGGTAGVVTMEDILEEIIGDIQDEHDKIKHVEKIISKHEYELSARLEIDYLNEKYNLNLPVSEEYETIAGLILAHYESIPKVNDQVEIEHITFKIVKASTTKIEQVNLKISNT
jgi:CBS domain containing-hemolysin-like protein